MKIDEAIAHYLDTRKAEGLKITTIETVGIALRKVFEPVLAEDIVVLTAEQVDHVRDLLGRREGRGGKLLGQSTRYSYWCEARAFLKWAVRGELLNADPLARQPVTHIGEIARRLREDAGLLRRDITHQTGLARSTLGNFETARINLSRDQLLRLLAAPCMATLPDKVKEAGLSLGLGDSRVGQ